MMKALAIIFSLILISDVMALPQSPNEGRGKFWAAGLDDDREVERFFTSFKEAVAKGDKKKVASLVAYPIKVTLVSGRRVTIKNQADFLSRYDRIFNETFKQVIAQTGVEDLWARWSGVAMPGGAIWFNGILKDARRPEKYRIKITVINGPIRPSRVPKRGE